MYAQVCVVITAAAASVVVVHRVLLSGGRVFCVSVHTCPATQGANRVFTTVQFEDIQVKLF